MVSFILRRVGVSALILLGASFIMFTLTALSGDPLADLYESRLPNRDQLIAARIQALNLDLPIPVRWLDWLRGAAGCLIPFADACDLGVTINNAEVADLLPRAMSSTLQLVTTATVLAILLGVTIGILSALRKDTGFDYSITFLSFLLYSLPSFWVAVLLKIYVAIGFNNFLADPEISVVAAIAIALVSGVIWQVLIGGPRRRRLLVFAATSIITGVVVWGLAAVDWFRYPALGPFAIILGSVGIAVGITALIAGLNNRRALITAGITALIGVICYFTLQDLFDISTLGTILILAVTAIAVGAITGYLVGGNDRRQSMRIGALTAIGSGALIVLDRFMQSWNSYMTNPRIGERPVATVGSVTPSLRGDFWVQGIDSFTHLLLPTLTLLLISFAGYTRYARAGMLDVLGQDYIRTARAKGLSNRVVIVRHAFRNSLIPIMTIVAADIGAILGGAIITEQIFAISGMGALFTESLRHTDPNPVMGYFVVIAIVAIAFNFIADLAYAALDPRVRVR
jgi:peptide/nickel transport system permease protein